MRRGRLLAILLLLVPAGCAAPQYAANWNDLEAGMTRSEVVALLGEPNSRVRLEQPGGRVARERWQYGEDSTTAASPSGLGLAPPDDVFVVTFGADGTVADFRRPLVGRYADPEPPERPAGRPPD